MDHVTTSSSTHLPNALQEALSLLERPPANPDITDGYLDLLGGEPSANSGPIQAVWESGIGSTLYDHAQSLSRRLSTMARLPDSAVQVPDGGRALDIGCGPGNVTALLSRAAGQGGLALGVDVSEPMLRRAVAAEANDNTGFVRADARRLPFHKGSFDVVSSLAALQLVPEPLNVLGQMSAMLAPGGHLAVMVPTVRDGIFHRLSKLTGNAMGLEFFEPGKVADTLHSSGMSTVHTQVSGWLLWVTASKADERSPIS